MEIRKKEMRLEKDAVAGDMNLSECLRLLMHRTVVDLASHMLSYDGGTRVISCFSGSEVMQLVGAHCLKRTLLGLIQ
jgi:hypothetical protein